MAKIPTPKDNFLALLSINIGTMILNVSGEIGLVSYEKAFDKISTKHMQQYFRLFGKKKYYKLAKAGRVIWDNLRVDFKDYYFNDMNITIDEMIVMFNLVNNEGKKNFINYDIALSSEYANKTKSYDWQVSNSVELGEYLIAKSKETTNYTKITKEQPKSKDNTVQRKKKEESTNKKNKEKSTFRLKRFMKKMKIKKINISKSDEVFMNKINIEVSKARKILSDRVEVGANTEFKDIDKFFSTIRLITRDYIREKQKNVKLKLDRSKVVSDCDELWSENDNLIIMSEYYPEFFEIRDVA